MEQTVGYHARTRVPRRARSGSRGGRTCALARRCGSGAGERIDYATGRGEQGRARDVDRNHIYKGIDRTAKTQATKPGPHHWRAETYRSNELYCA